MVKKGSKLYSIFKLKCPRCHEGELFDERNPYILNKLYSMPRRCEKCDQRFELEPGFYFGGMYVSYALSIAWLVAVFVAMLVLYPSFNVNEYLLIGLGSLILLGPLIFKLSRAVYINFFVNYDPEALRKNKKD